LQKKSRVFAEGFMEYGNTYGRMLMGLVIWIIYSARAAAKDLITKEKTYFS